MDEGTQRWIVTVSPARPIDDIVRELSARGLTDPQVLGEIGCILGSAESACVPGLRSVSGVLDVSPEVPVTAFQ